MPNLATLDYIVWDKNILNNFTILTYVKPGNSWADLPLGYGLTKVQRISKQEADDGRVSLRLLF